MTPELNQFDRNISAEVRQNMYMGSELEMMWHCQADPRFCYLTYVPEKAANDPGVKLGLMSFVHGTGRTVEEYRSLFKPFADEFNLALIFPLFPGGLYDKNDFDNYKFLAYGDVRYDNIFLSMCDEFAERFPNIDSSRIFLYGWSGGGQFVQRFLYTHPERLAGLVVGAPGRITYIDPDRDFYDGTRNFEEIFHQQLRFDEMRKVPICLLIGEKDVLNIGENPHGNSRMARMKALKENYESYGLQVEMQVMPGIGHKDNYPIKAPYVTAFFRRILEQARL